MSTAKETRQAAWDLLRAGSYGTYLVGSMVLGSIGVCVVFLLLGLFFAGAVAIIGKMPDAVTAFLDGMGKMDPHAFVESLEEELSERLPVIWVGLGAWGLFLVSFVGYLIGFASWSGYAMAIACARRGLTVAHAFSGWGHGWRMLVLLCWRVILVLLWTMLLIVPGVRALYSYALAPYLQVDHPDWKSMRCLKASKRLKEGHRMELFFLHISFIGWYILAICAKKVVPLVGGLSDFLLTPYPETAFALFYEERLDADERTAEVRGEPPRPDAAATASAVPDGDYVTTFSRLPSGCAGNDTTEEERNKTHDD